MSTNLLNKYRIMWIHVIFDLPTLTIEERKIAQNFRKSLLKDGFAMLQLSVYVRHCASRENAEVHKKRIKKLIPKKGSVIITEMTDAQFARMEHFIGILPTKGPKNPNQLELF